MECCDIWKVFDEQNNLIKEYKHWKLLIRNRNTTLGNCVAITKRHMQNLSEITPQEMEEFAYLVKDIETALKQSFSNDKINYMMLMMKDPHAHFHIIPRYSETRNFAGIEWSDEGWPRTPSMKKPSVSNEILKQVKDEILKNMKSPPE